MSTRQAQHLRALQIEALKIQQEHLLVVRDRHRAWIQNSDDMETYRIRREIIDLIEKTIDHYDELLKALQRQESGE
jgi:hypothetical protein